MTRVSTITPPMVALAPTSPCPTIFLAGPIQNAPDWQSQAIRILAKRIGAFKESGPRKKNRNPDDVVIASPRRLDLSGFDYSAQVDWEHENIARAEGNGVLMFWLAAAETLNMERAYAQTSRFELGEAIGRQLGWASAFDDRGERQHGGDASRIVVGIEPGFTGERYIRYTLGKKAPWVPICSTLAETCETAAAWLEVDR